MFSFLNTFARYEKEKAIYDADTETTTDRQLYRLVGPLVMNPKVLQYNNGYPFKTGEHYVWYIAIEKQKVMGFIPLEMRKNEHIINNYYAEAETHDYILDTLLNTVLTDEEESTQPLSAVVQTPHQDLFVQKGFEITKSWKLYIKMQKA